MKITYYNIFSVCLSEKKKVYMELLSKKFFQAWLDKKWLTEQPLCGISIYNLQRKHTTIQMRGDRAHIRLTTMAMLRNSWLWAYFDVIPSISEEVKMEYEREKSRIATCFLAWATGRIILNVGSRADSGEKIRNSDMSLKCSLDTQLEMLKIEEEA